MSPSEGLVCGTGWIQLIDLWAALMSMHAIWMRCHLRAGAASVVQTLVALHSVRYNIVDSLNGPQFDSLNLTNFYLFTFN